MLTMALVANVIRRGVPGDMIETGVYKGGSTIAMLHVLGLQGSPKKVYACDAFQGLPDSVVQDNSGCKHQLSSSGACKRGHRGEWASSRAIFDDNLQYYGQRITMSRRSEVLMGWFSDTLPRFRKHHEGKEGTLSLLRLDGDVYSSTKVRATRAPHACTSRASRASRASSASLCNVYNVRNVRNVCNASTETSTRAPPQVSAASAGASNAIVREHHL